MSLNSDGENMLVLPPLDVSMQDKMFLLKATKNDAPLPDGVDAYGGWKELLVSQLPGLADWLLSIEIPEEIADRRYGVVAWQNPELVAALDEHAPEERLWDIIENVIFSGDDRTMTTTAANLEEVLVAGNKSAHKIFSFPTACGVYLSRLELKGDGRVTRAAARSTWHLSKLP